MQLNSATVAEECWRSAIPVQLQLAESEVSSLEQPPVLYFLIPRHSYLHSLVPQALPLLQHLLPPGELVPWFEHGRLPLKWGVPAGVLYDLLAAPSGELPWQLTLHFRGFPDRQLPAYGGEAALRSAFFNSLKEAAHICRGSAQRIMEMAAGAQEDLWRQVVAGRLQQYQQIVGPLQLAPAVVRGRSAASIPLRLYIRRDGGGYLSSYEDIAATSRPVPATASDGGWVSLRQALVLLLEECLRDVAAEESAAGGTATPDAVGATQGTAATEEGTEAAASAGGAGEGGEAGGSTGGDPEGARTHAGVAEPPEAEPSAASLDGGVSSSALPTPALEGGAAAATVSAAQAAVPPAPAPQPGVAGAAGDLLERLAADRGLLVAGTTPPLDTPLAWLHAQLHAGDHFLYVVLHVGRAQKCS